MSEVSKDASIDIIFFALQRVPRGSINLGTRLKADQAPRARQGGALSRVKKGRQAKRGTGNSSFLERKHPTAAVTDSDLCVDLTEEAGHTGSAEETPRVEVVDLTSVPGTFDSLYPGHH